jgi:hypothetical protein
VRARRTAVILLSWWFLYLLSPDGRWQREFGPIGDSAACERIAQAHREKGLEARCVEFRF